MCVLFGNDKKKTYCGRYKGVAVFGLGCVIGSRWYGDYYASVPRGKSRRLMKVKGSERRSVDELKKYIDEHIDELVK